MACIATEPNGRRRILFIGPDGARKTIRLGRASMKQAESFKARVESMVAAAILGHATDDDTTRWLAGLDAVAYDRLAAVGLAKTRNVCILKPWIDGYLAERTDLKPRTLKSLRQTLGKLVAFFGADRPMRSITRDEASRWRADLMAKHSIATVRLHVGNARTLFGQAVERELIPANQFDHLPSGTTAAANARYVTPDEADRVMSALSDPTARIVFALARWGGLRVPSETHLLTWADVDWSKGRLKVRSPKTEHHAGHESRIVPITAKLMAELQRAFDAVPEGESRAVFGERSNERIRNVVLAAIKRAEVESWDDLFRTLRASCEREWAMTFPQYAASKWIGHSITVSGKHYANHVPDELFDKAAHFPAQHTSESAGIGRKESPAADSAVAENPNDFRGLPTYAGVCEDASRTVRTDPSSRRCGALACD